MSRQKDPSFGILETECNEDFFRAMRDRMVVSWYKYGPVREAYPHKVDAIASLRDRLRLYLLGDKEKDIKPGNTEYLVDIANFAMIEFMLPRHRNAHFEGTDDSGSPGRVSVKTGARDKRNNTDLPE